MEFFSIEPCNTTFESIKSKPYYPLAYDSDIQESSLLILPLIENQMVLFPEITNELLDYLSDNGSSFKTNIVISDEDYQKVEKHCDWIELGILLVRDIVLPLAISLIANFVYDRIKKLNKKDDEVSTEVEIIVEQTKTKKSKKIKYKGPVEGIKETLDNAAKDIFNEK